MAESTPRDSTWFYFACRHIIWAICRVFLRLEAHGASNIPEHGGLLLASNHASNLDPAALGCTVKRPTHFLAKDELLKIPVFGWWARHVNVHPIRRGVVDRKALRQANRILASGSILAVFPEGTRTRDGALGTAKPGVAMMAVQAGTPCFAAYIDGAFRAWPRHRLFPLPRKVRVFFGAPFDFPPRADGISSKEYYQICADEMLRQIDGLRKEAEAFRSRSGKASA